MKYFIYDNTWSYWLVCTNGYMTIEEAHTRDKLKIENLLFLKGIKFGGHREVYFLISKELYNFLKPHFKDNV